MGDVPQLVPSDPSLDTTYRWRFSLCAASRSPLCPERDASFLFEEAPAASRCEVQFTTQTLGWAPRYGGQHAVFANAAADRTANVTVVCDRGANGTVADGPVVALPYNQGW